MISSLFYFTCFFLIFISCIFVYNWFEKPCIRLEDLNLTNKHTLHIIRDLDRKVILALDSYYLYSLEKIDGSYQFTRGLTYFNGYTDKQLEDFLYEVKKLFCIDLKVEIWYG